MIQRFCFILLLCVASNIIYAQHGKIQGNISGPDQKVLAGITISMEGWPKATQTDDDGNFFFTGMQPGNYVLIASGVGYKAKSSRITVENNKTIFLRLELDIATSTLREVHIAGKRPSAQSGALTRTNTPLRDIPQNIQSVDRTTINDQQLFQLDEALRNVAGFTSTDYYGSFSSRGYTSGIGGVTTNGITGSPYPEGQLPLLGNIESVEVIHGPSAILYGQGGMGGNINMVTKQPKKYQVVNATVAAGSFDLIRAQADITGSINKKKNLYFLAGAGWQNGGSFTRHFDRRSIQVYGSLKWEVNPKTSWQINGNYVNEDASNNYQPRVPIYKSKDKDSIFLVPYDFNPGYDSRYKGNNYQLQSVMEHRISGNWKIGLLAAYSESRADRNQYTASGFVRPTDNTVSRSYSWQQINSPQTTVNIYTNVKVNTWKIIHQVTIGGDAMLSRNNYPNGILQYAATRLPVFDTEQESRYDTTGMTFYGKSRTEKFTYNTFGAYVQDQIEITSKWKILAGLRYNNYFRRYFADKPDGTVQNDERPLRTENFSPRLGVVYQPVSTVSIYLDYNEGFSPHYSNNVENGGPFAPETSKQYEFGAKGEFFQNTFQPFISIYQSDRKNVLQSVPKPDLPYWREAIGQVQSRGIEIGAKGTLLGNLFLNVNYNYNKTKITKSIKPEDIGQLFANSPENSANGWAKYTFTTNALKGLFIGAGFQYVDARYFSNKKETSTDVLEMPAYTVFNALIGYRYKQYSLQVNGNNLANKRYAASGVVNSYTPGAPRNLLVSLNCSFR
ncbi:TonB-dependent receptor [Chitinophaga sp. CC14]|uniref:TonB-dependent siderophore receptor n=1 Tax=Chitinophaga sp. CC14 TaxID=3029199 RepID=UPI003B7CE331